jgi:mycothiol synthase
MCKLSMCMDENDYGAIRTMISKNYSVQGSSMYASVGGLDFCRFILDDEPSGIFTSSLWKNDLNEVIGFAWPEEERIDIISLFKNKNIEDEILEWAENSRKLQRPHDAEEWSLTVPCNTNDIGRQEILTKRGYIKTDSFCCLMSRSLINNPIPELNMPEGYSLHTVTSEKDIKQRAKLNSISAGEIKIDKYYNMMKSPTYNNSLDLIVKNSDDDIIAFCTAWYDEKSEMGLLEPLGCCLAHRRKGIMKCILYEAMKRFKKLGAKRTYLYTSNDAEEAISLYENTGFDYGRDYDWIKKL